MVKRRKKHLSPALIFGPVIFLGGVYILLICSYAWGGQYLICNTFDSFACHLEIRRWFGRVVVEQEVFEGITGVSRRAVVTTKDSSIQVGRAKRQTDTVSWNYLVAETEKGERAMLGGTAEEIDGAVNEIRKYQKENRKGPITYDVLDSKFVIVGSIFGFVFSLVGCLILGFYVKDRFTSLKNTQRK